MIEVKLQFATLDEMLEQLGGLAHQSAPVEFEETGTLDDLNGQNVEVIADGADDPEPKTTAEDETETEESGPELDANGAEWNPELHTRTKTKNADGTWRLKRGAKKAEVAAPAEPETTQETAEEPEPTEPEQPASLPEMSAQVALEKVLEEKGMAEARAVLKQFGAERLSEVTEAQTGDFITACVEAAQ